MKDAYVNVLLEDGTTEWRAVQANTLIDALQVAIAMVDVADVYEASWTPGGCAT